MGHGSIEPDNSGGTVDIEGFFRRYEGIEPPLPIQRGSLGCSGGIGSIKDRENAPQVSPRGVFAPQIEEPSVWTGWNRCCQASISSSTQTARLRYLRRSGACPALPNRSKCWRV